MIAGLCFVPFIFSGLREIKTSQYVGILGIGIVGTAIPAFLFPLAMTRITGVVAGILNSLSPLFTLVLGIAFFWLLVFG